MGGPVCGGEDHLLESALHRVVIKRGATGSRPARARQPMWPPGGGGARQPFPSGAPAAPPLGTCDVRAFHGCYTVARGGAPVREAARAPTQAGRGSSAQCQHQHQHQHQTRAPLSPARRLPSGSRARTLVLPCAAQVWSCCAARAPGTRPGPGRTRGSWGTSVSCRACSAWRSATCPAPLTSSVCRGRSSRTCGRCWLTGCWRYCRDGSPLPRRPCVLGSGHPGAALLGHPGLNNNRQDAPVAQTPGPGLSRGTLAGCLCGAPFLFPSPTPTLTASGLAP